MTPVDAATPLPPPSVPGGWGAPRYSTGLRELDDRVGGLVAGELWVLTGAPGQGRSMLLTQLGRRLAVDHCVSTWLSSNRDAAVVVSGRMHAALAHVPLNHVADDRLTDVDESRLRTATQQLAAAPLHVRDGRFAADYITDELLSRPPEEPAAALLDDPAWGSEWPLEHARRIADRGVIVVVTLPRERVLDGPAYRCDLLPEMTLTDVVVEVRHSNLAAADVAPTLDQPGFAALAVLRNRRGPVGTAVVAFQGHYARFVDRAEPDPAASKTTGSRTTQRDNRGGVEPGP